MLNVVQDKASDAQTCSLLGILVLCKLGHVCNLAALTDELQVLDHCGLSATLVVLDEDLIEAHLKINRVVIASTTHTVSLWTDWKLTYLSGTGLVPYHTTNVEKLKFPFSQLDTP